MRVKARLVTVLLFGSVSVGETDAADRTIEGCEEAIVLLSDGVELRGSVIQVGPDTLWVEVGGGPSSMGEGPSNPVSRTERFPIRDIRGVLCGDSPWDGFFSGLLAGCAVGGAVGAAVASGSEVGWWAVPFVAAWAAPPCALLGLILDQSSGEGFREYGQEDLMAMEEGSEGGAPVREGRWLGRDFRHGLAVGPHVQLFFPGESESQVMSMVGLSLVRLGRKGLFQDLSFGVAESRGEQWISLAFDAGISWMVSTRASPYAQLGLRYYRRDYGETYRGTLFNPNDLNDMDIAIGGGVLIEPGWGNLLIRPSFAFNWTELWDLSEVKLGVYYGF